MKATMLLPAYHELNSEQKRLVRFSFLKEFFPKAAETYFYKAIKKDMPAEQFIWLLIRLDLLKTNSTKDLKAILPSSRIKRVVPVSIQYKELASTRKRKMREGTGLAVAV